MKSGLNKIRLVRLIILAGMMVFMNSCGKAPKSDLWWTYVADYDGRPGSIIVNLALKGGAPAADYQELIVTGVSYTPSDTNGLPGRTELEFLYALSEKRLKAISELTPLIFAGAFTHNGERLDYIYVRNSKGVEEILKRLYQDSCPDRKPYINIKPDPKWEAYFAFLFPNQATIEFYRKELTEIGYLKK